MELSNRSEGNTISGREKVPGSFKIEGIPNADLPFDHVFKAEGISYDRIFRLVKKTVKSVLNKERTGIGLALSNLPNRIGAYWQLGGNYIVMNETIINYMKSIAKSPEEFNSFLFAILTHEYLHSVGYINELDARRVTAQVAKTAFGKDHAATKLSSTDLWSMYPTLLLLPDGDGSRMRIISNFDTDATSYIT